MKKSMVAALIGLAVGLGSVSSSQAEEAQPRSWAWSPVGIGLAAPLQLPYMESDVYGIRLGGFFGANAAVYGLDCGLAELTYEDFVGAQFSLLSWTEGSAYGLQASAFANVVELPAVGVQAACVNVDWTGFTGLQLGLVNYDIGFTGLQLGALLNWNTTVTTGLQAGLVNVDLDDFAGAAFGLVNKSNAMTGFQLGLVNVCREGTGCQVGLFNAAERLRGVQIGLLNLIANNRKLPVMVLANAAF